MLPISVLPIGACGAVHARACTHVPVHLCVQCVQCVQCVRPSVHVEWQMSGREQFYFEKACSIYACLRRPVVLRGGSLKNALMQ